MLDSAKINISGSPINAENPNQLDQRLLGPQGLVFADGVDSSSRKQMFGSHLGQMLTISVPSERKIQTGMEYEYGKYTFNVTMPESGRILKIIDRFPSRGNSEDSFKLNSERLIIYQGESGTVGMVSLPFYCVNHPYFGFQYKPTQEFGKIIPNQHIKEGTVLLDSPNKGPNGEYMYGLELNVAFMTHPAVAEDGIVLRRGVLEKLKYHTYEKRVINFGRKHYPINLYGDDNNYKSFPDIGELVEPKGEHPGLLIALRQYDQDLITVDQSVKALQRVDHIFDKCYYADGAGGRVVDIKMYHQKPGRAETNCPEQLTQVFRYANATYQFHKEIVNYYLHLLNQYGASLRLSPELDRLIVESMAVTRFHMKTLPDNLRLTYKATPMDEFRMEVLVEYLKTPTLGAKVTDTMGGKGVNVLILEDHEMPRDQYGNVADAIFDPNATNNRMNYGRGYEHFFNATGVNLVSVIRNHLNIPTNIPESIMKTEINNVITKDSSKADYVFSHLQNYYNMISPTQAEWYGKLTPKEKAEDLYYILKDGLQLHFAPNNPLYFPDIVKNLNENYPVKVGPVTYTGYSGKQITTKYPVMIGSVYCILLEKVGDDWSAVNTSKTQHNGIITYVAPGDKDTTPTKEQATRVLGETEFRMTTSYVGGKFSAEMHDRSSSPATRQQIAKTILKADTPTMIDQVADRSVNPLGYSKPLQLLNEIAACAGWEFAYSPFDPDQQKRKPVKIGESNE